MNNIKYSVNVENAHARLIRVVVDVSQTQGLETLISLPKWRPGRYEFNNYPANLYKIKAVSSDGTGLVIIRRDTHNWILKHNHGTRFSLEYLYFANSLDAGGSYVDEHQVYLNPINFCVFFPGYEDVKCALTIEGLGRGHFIATSLERDGNILYAQNFHELADSPIIVSKSILQVPFNVGSNRFIIWIQGKSDFDVATLVSDFTKFTLAQFEVLDFESNRPFHYLIQIVPYKFYHGVEHANSTTIVIGAEGDGSKELYENLIGICSHELFHYWNVKRLRPKEMTPYNYGKEPYFSTGYVIEGFTTYFGDLTICRGGVFDFDWYISELNKLLKKHFENFGRLNLSVMESSIELWVDGYRQIAPNRRVSIYNEGAIVALMLDLLIREQSKGENSLDSLMKELWESYYINENGYTHENVKIASSKIAKTNLDWFFEKYVEGYDRIYNELKRLLELAGLTLEVAYPKNTIERKLGLKYQKVSDKIIITAIDPTSEAYMKLSIGDEIVEIDNAPITDFEKISEFKNEITIKIKSFGSTQDVKINCAGQSFYEYYEVKRLENATEEQLEFQKKWINLPKVE